MNRFRKAQTGDIAAIAEMMEAYYRQDRYVFDRECSEAAILRLIQDPAPGCIWVALLDGRTAGYLALTLGFSLEYGGVDAFVDELYITEWARRQGLGSEALRIAEEYCRTRGVRALHLEVEPHREQALALYRSRGFIDHDRHLMTKQIDHG